MKQITNEVKEHYFSGKVTVKPFTVITSLLLSVAAQIVFLMIIHNPQAIVYQYTFLIISAIAPLIIPVSFSLFKSNKAIWKTSLFIVTMFEPIMAFAAFYLVKSDNCNNSIVHLSIASVVGGIMAYIALMYENNKIGNEQISPSLLNVITLSTTVIGLTLANISKWVFRNNKYVPLCMVGTWLFSFLFFYSLFYMIKQITINSHLK